MGLAAPQHVGSSRTRAQTYVPCIGRQILNHCTTREAPQKVFDKEIEKIMNNQTELKNKITKVKNTLEGINSRINETEKWISDQEYRVVEITALEQNKEKMKNEDSLRDLWDNVKCTNVCITGVPEGKEREKRPEKISEEIIAENFPNMGKEAVTQSRKCRESYTGLTQGGPR